ncbi:MAG: Minf_1886 family protein [Planctomycetota bacterium]
MSDSQLEEKLSELTRLDPRYDARAYAFIFDVLDYTIASLGRESKRGPDRHVSVHELLDGVRRFAIQEFGPLARAVLEKWGVYRTEDLGEIVFNMIDAGLLNAREEDDKSGFANGFSFRDELERFDLEMHWEQIA